jgi:phenylacetate-CoA ligase
MKNPEINFEKKIKDNFRAKLRVTPEIIYSSISEIYKIQSPDVNRKPKKFIDHRKISHT